MPTIVEIPEIGEVSFDDSMDESSILTAIRRDILKLPEAQQQADVPEEPTLQAPRQTATQPNALWDAVRRTQIDPRLSLWKGIVSVPEAVVGLLDIPTRGYAGKILEAGGYGFQPKLTKEILSSLASPEQKAANARVQSAIAAEQGLIPKAGAALSASIQNPSTIAHAIIESVPSMLAGGAIGRTLAAAGKVAPVIAGAIGEGTIAAGASAENIRQQTKDGLLTWKQAGHALASGSATGLIGALGGKLANRFGLADIDTLASGGVSEQAKAGIIRRVIGGAIAEGVFEELPQSSQERIQSNLALGKPATEGVAEDAVMGMLAGMAMGGFAGIPGGAGGAAAAVDERRRAQVPGGTESAPPPAAAAPPVPPAFDTAQLLGRTFEYQPGKQAQIIRADDVGFSISSPDGEFSRSYRELNSNPADVFERTVESQQIGSAAPAPPLAQPPPPALPATVGVRRRSKTTKPAAAETPAPAPVAAALPSVASQAETPVITEANQVGDTIDLAFDVTKPAPTVQQIRESISQAGHAATVLEIAPEMSSAVQGVKRFRITGLKAGRNSTEAAARIYKDVFGLEGYHKAKSVLEESSTLGQRLSAASRIGQKAELEATPKKATEQLKTSESSPATTPKSSTQLTVNKAVATRFIGFARAIPDSKVYHKPDATGKEDFGIETEPHITVLYGLTEHTPEPVRKAVAAHGPITVTLGKLSLFELDDYDVLKVDVTGDDRALRALNAEIKKLPNEQTFPDYKPHLTIAYMKKGEGKKYVDNTTFEGQTLTFDTLTFSPPSEVRQQVGVHEIPFKAPASIPPTAGSQPKPQPEPTPPAVPTGPGVAPTLPPTPNAPEAPTGVVDTIAGRMNLTEFESKGYAPEQVTRLDWINLQRAERRRLGQSEESGTPNAPFADYEQYHKQQVDRALKKGEEVDPQVLEDYPELQKIAAQPAVEWPTLLEFAKSKLSPGIAAKITSESQVESFRAQWEKELAAKPPPATQTPTAPAPELTAPPVAPTPAVPPSVAEIQAARKTVRNSEKKLAKMGAMVPPPIRAEVAAKVAEQRAKLDRLESALMESDKTERQRQIEAGDKFDAEQDAVVGKIQRSEPVTRDELNTYFAPDSTWRRLAEERNLVAKPAKAQELADLPVAEGVNQWLTVPVPDIGESMDAAKFAARQANEIRNQRDEVERQIATWKKANTLQRGPQYQRGKIKKSVRKSERDAYQALLDRRLSLSQSIEAVETGSAKDRSASERLGLSNRINDTGQPLLSRLLARKELFFAEKQTPPEALLSAIGRETDAVLRQRFPDITAEESKRLGNAVVRAYSGGGDVARVFELDPELKLPEHRRSELIDAHGIHTSDAVTLEFSDGLKQELSKFIPAYREFGDKRPLESLPRATLDALVARMGKEAEAIQARRAKEAEAAEKAAKEMEAKFTRVIKTEPIADAIAAKQILIRELETALIDAPAEQHGNATLELEIPGDGTFTVQNNQKAISEVLERAKKISTSTARKPFTENKPTREQGREWLREAEELARQEPPKFSSAEPGGDTGVRKATVAKWIADTRQRLGGNFPVVIVDSLLELPEDEYQALVTHERITGQIVDGFTNQATSTVYLIAPRLADAQAAQQTFLEETLGHNGMEKLLNAEEVRTLAAMFRQHRPQAWQTIVADYQFDVRSDEGQRDAVSELLAKEARTIPESDPLWQRIVDVIAKALHRLGLFQDAIGARVLSAKIRDLARSARSRFAQETKETIPLSDGRTKRFSGQTRFSSRPAQPAQVEQRVLQDISALDPDLQKEIGEVLVKAGADEEVKTKVFNAFDVVINREQMTPEVIENGRIYARNFFGGLGLPVEQDESGFWKLVDETADAEIAGRQMVEALTKELTEKEIAAPAKGYLGNLLNSVVVNMTPDRVTAFSQDTRNELHSLAQGERSHRGLLLGMLSHGSRTVEYVARNVSAVLQRVYADAFAGDTVRKFVDGIRKSFGSYFTGEVVNGVLEANPQLQEAIDRINAERNAEKIIPSIAELVRQILATPLYRQSEIRERFSALLQKTYAVDPEQAERAAELLERVFSARYTTAKRNAIDKALAALTPQERKALKKKPAVWKKIEAAVNAGVFETGALLNRIGQAHGWMPLTPEIAAKMRALAERMQRLRELTPEEITEIESFSSDPAAVTLERQRALAEREALTRQERLQIKKQIEVMWSRLSHPLNFKGNAENVMNAAYEWASAVLLLKFGFPTRQIIDVATQGFLHSPTRAIAAAWDRIELNRQEGKPLDAAKEISSAIGSGLKTYLKALRPAAAKARAVLGGGATGRNVENLVSQIALFERIAQQAEEATARGEHTKALVLRLVTWVRAARTFASALDQFQGTPAEYQEVRQQVVTSLRERGKSPAEAEMAADEIVRDPLAEWQLAITHAQAMSDKLGLDYTPAQVRSSAEDLALARAYQRMREAGLPADDFMVRNAEFRETIGWNVKEEGGIGGFVGAPLRALSTFGAKFTPAAVFSIAFGRFANAISISAVRAASFTPLGFFPSAFGVKESELGRSGVATTGSAWYRTASDRRQRKVEASIGTMLGMAAIALVATGVASVRWKPPDDKEERELWFKLHKPYTVEFNLGDGSFIPFSLTTGPFRVIAPYLVGTGALMERLEQSEKRQAKLDADAAAKGLQPGVARGLDVADYAFIAGQAAWSTLIGGRTATGLVGAVSDYGIPNVTKMAASALSAVIPGLPAIQEAARAIGIFMDPKLASFFDYLVPLPTSKGRSVNFLGEAVSTEDDIRRVIQVATGGSFPFPVSPAELASQPAYQSLLASGYRPSSINPNRGYNVRGEFRPFTDDELGRYTQLRGNYFKQALSGLGPGADREAAADAYQQANERALVEMGVVIESGVGAFSGSSATATPSATLGVSAASAASARPRASGMSGVRRSFGVRLPSSNRASAGSAIQRVSSYGSNRSTRGVRRRGRLGRRSVLGRSRRSRMTGPRSMRLRRLRRR